MSLFGKGKNFPGSPQTTLVRKASGTRVERTISFHGVQLCMIILPRAQFDLSFRYWCTSEENSINDRLTLILFVTNLTVPPLLV